MRTEKECRRKKEGQKPSCLWNTGEDQNLSYGLEYCPEKFFAEIQNPHWNLTNAQQPENYEPLLVDKRGQKLATESI